MDRRTMTVTVLHGDCLALLPTLAADSFDACITDPPYHLTAGSRGGGDKGFMGESWDGGDIAFRPETWAAILRVLKPGAHLAAFGGTRTAHRMTTAIEEAGFEIRDRQRYECSFWTKYGPLLDSLSPEQAGAVMDMLHDASGLGEAAWVYGQGFPKSRDVSKAIDKAAGAEREVLGVIDPRSKFDGRVRQSAAINTNWRGAEGREDVRDLSQKKVTLAATSEAALWEGWGTALKPAFEPIILARKPLIGTVAANVLRHGCGGLNIGACRVPTDDKLGGGAETITTSHQKGNEGWTRPWVDDEAARAAHAERVRCNVAKAEELGRWPANVLHDGSDEVKKAFEVFGERSRGHTPAMRGAGGISTSGHRGQVNLQERFGNTGSAARFFYCAKASKADRAGSKHPTVKPIALLQWLARLITPPGGTVLDPFAGSGTTGAAARLEGFAATLIEQKADYIADIHRRFAHAAGVDLPLFTEVAMTLAPGKPKPDDRPIPPITWRCPLCRNVAGNFAHRAVCAGCGEPKPSTAA